MDMTWTYVIENVNREEIVEIFRNTNCKRQSNFFRTEKLMKKKKFANCMLNR